MKKRMVLFAILLATLAYANVPYDSTYPPTNTSQNTVYSDFPLDNIHILRLQEASMALGRNVSVLHDELEKYQTSQANQLSGMQASIDAIGHAMDVRVGSLQQTVKELDQPALVQESSHASFYLLLVSNIVLFGIVIVLLIVINHKPLAEDHIHPAPPELVSYIRNSRKSAHELRTELIAKGWPHAHVENSIKSAGK